MKYKLFKEPFRYVKDVSVIPHSPAHKSTEETFILFPHVDPSLIKKVYGFEKSGGLRLC